MITTVLPDNVWGGASVTLHSETDIYTEFLKSKACFAPHTGFDIELSEIHPWFHRHQPECIRWSVKGGRRLLALNFGMGKTGIQLETVRLTLKHHSSGRGLIVLPLGVRQEFIKDGAKIGIVPRFIRTTSEIDDDGYSGAIYMTNYESIREGLLNPREFTVASLDEGAVLRSFGGTKTFRKFMEVFETVPYRFVATATPSPNEYLELLAYADFLGIMDVGQAKTRFFQRDSEHMDRLTLMPHMSRDFWLWVSSWALYLYAPSDLGHSDDGYDLPEIHVVYHEVPVNHTENAGKETDGQLRMIKDAAMGVSQAARAKKETLASRIDKMLEIVTASPEDHFVLWHDLEDERRAIERALPGSMSVYGSQKLDVSERIVSDFAENRLQYLGGKPSMLGSGTNLQHFCSRAIFVGIGFKFKDFIQSIHRIQRFGQLWPVRVDIIYAESERRILQVLLRKWAQHVEAVENMRQIIREYGLNHDIQSALVRSLGVDRVEVSGDNWTLVHNDSVLEARSMSSDSVGLIATSIPFGTQYEYAASMNDFGHNDDSKAFWKQQDFLTPELYRVLKPGRILAIHVKDRVVPGGITGLGFRTIAPFHCEAILHYMKHNFAFMGMATVATDVVRENKQTERLGWSEMCKDGTTKGFGQSEYILQFRKPPTDNSNGYADTPVTHSKYGFFDNNPNSENYGEFVVVDKNGYSRPRWQFDAHGVWQSSGNRLLSQKDVDGMSFPQIYRLWKQTCIDLSTVYDYEFHVKVGENLDAHMKLPPSFSLIPVHLVNSENIWTDVTRMRTLNLLQYQKGFEQHLCPLQTDICDRIIERFSNPGDIVYDPFCGIGSIPYCAVKKGRYGYGSELNPSYFLDSCFHMKHAAEQYSTPSLFDLLEQEQSTLSDANEPEELLASQ